MTKKKASEIEEDIQASENEEEIEVSSLEKTSEKDGEKEANEEGETLDQEESEEKAENESISDKKKKLLEKAKALKEKMALGQASSEELKEKVKDKKKKGTELLPLDDYVRSGIYIGTKVVTPKMRQFVYRRRADGLAIFNTDIIDSKLKDAIDYLSGFAPNEVILACKREAGWNAAELFSKCTGIRIFTKKYPAGIMTNTKLDDFFEVDLVIITDSWLDKNALNDALNINKQTLLICDTNNFPPQLEHIVIGNNKSAKSLGLMFYLLAKGYCEKRGIESDIPSLDVWMEEKV